MEALSIIDQSQFALQAAKVPPQLGKVDSIAEAAKVAQDFEAFFLGQMLQPMFQNLEAAPPFGGGPGDKIWRAMMVDEMGKAMAKSGGIGLADSVQAEILRMQENSQ
ncbi:MAG: rod-binding protein [Rhodospirillales bacterium]|nr:rod-binding protein [Rhodospirillales bacterium]